MSDSSNSRLDIENNLTADYWDKKWQHNETGWDIGFVSPPIEEYISKFEDKEARILIPGCGNAYEAEFLSTQGFKNITILDISPTAVQILKEKYKDMKEISVICSNFFEHNGNYDLIIEQTFFCAIPTSKRKSYANKAFDLLSVDGRVIGLMFNKHFTKQGPPFGGNVEEYKTVFNPYFEIVKMEECYNSIESRRGSEIFINLKKKSS